MPTAQFGSTALASRCSRPAQWRLHRLAKAVDPNCAVGIQHQLDDIRFGEQLAQRAELPPHAFCNAARLFVARGDRLPIAHPGPLPCGGYDQWIWLYTL